MTDARTQTYEVDGDTFRFDFDAFAIAFSSRAKLGRKKIAEYEGMLADAVSVSPATVHAWRMRKNAPGDIDLVRKVEAFMSAEPDAFLAPLKGDDDMNKLSDCERAAVSRVYSAITDFLFMLNNTDGCVWKSYKVPEGSPYSAYLLPDADAALTGTSPSELSGTELADAGYGWTCHALEREWVVLGQHPIYEEIAEFMYGTMNDIYDGKTDPDYRFHYSGRYENPEDEPWEGYGEHYAGWIDQEQAYAEIREIIGKYL